MSSSFRLSPEQEAILATAQPPFKANPSKLIRITAAAGTGKTTTLLHLAEACAQQGHTHISYITFNKSAAADGKARLEGSLAQHNSSLAVRLEARTLHSCAMSLLSHARNEHVLSEEQMEERVLSEGQVMEEIERLLEGEIQQFLRPCRAEIHRLCATTTTTPSNNHQRRLQSMESFAKKQVVFFIYKTLVQFCHSKDSLDEFHDARRTFGRDYYPVKKFFGDPKKSAPAGFVPHVYNTQVSLSWYANQANRLWELLKKIRTYDLEMKRAQLLDLEIPGSLLLVDECQDMDGCQVAWVSQQALRANKLLYLVGDAAQTIYSFRGAKSKFLMDLPATVDCTLTTSWRFGPSIANIANIVLFCKEHCPQTNQRNKKPTWRPYRVTGGSKCAGQVTTDKLDWQTQGPVTLIAHQNATLLMEAVAMLGITPAPPHYSKDDDDDAEAEDCVPIVSRENSLSSDEEKAEDEIVIPKMHINGNGDNSGMKKWKSVAKEIACLHSLYTSETVMVLPRREFPAFYGLPVTWDVFVQQVKARELNRYAASMSVVQKFKERTMEAMNLFQQHVMEKNYKAEEADIILSTCHAAKGMEWNNVQVCDDFTDEVSKVDCKGPRKLTNGKRPFKPSWQFATKEYGDDLNLLYVACTRAKQLLSVPPPLKLLLEQCDMLHELQQGKPDILVKEKDQPPPAKKQKTAAAFLNLLQHNLTEEEAADLYSQLVVKLRREMSASNDQRLLNKLLTSIHPTQFDDKEDTDVETPVPIPE